MFSSKCCCLAPLNNPAMLEEEDSARGLERSEEASEEVEEEEEEELDEAEAMEATAAAAAALLSCSREWEIRARSTLGGSGRVEGAGPPVPPRVKPPPAPAASIPSP